MYIDTKHFIWIVPLILVIGFILGYVSGLTIPKEITFSIDKDTLAVMNKSLDKQGSCPNIFDAPPYFSVLSVFNESQDFKHKLNMCEHNLEITRNYSKDITRIADEYNVEKIACRDTLKSINSFYNSSRN